MITVTEVIPGKMESALAEVMHKKGSLICIIINSQFPSNLIIWTEIFKAKHAFYFLPRIILIIGSDFIYLMPLRK
jgi:hypothetical protein